MCTILWGTRHDIWINEVAILMQKAEPGYIAVDFILFEKHSHTIPAFYV